MNVTRVDPGLLSQGQLVRRRFARSWMAVLALRLLVVLYVGALGAEFFSTNDPDRRDLNYAFCPPTLPRWSWSEGWHVQAMRLQEDPVTLRKFYVEDATITVPIRWWVRGAEYRWLGVVPGDRHVFGVPTESVAAAEVAGHLRPVLFLFGADRYGRDLYSRVWHGARVSLSIGLMSITVALVLGVGLGGVSGYVGGQTDNLIQRVIEIINSVPQLPLWLAIAAVLPATWSSTQVYLAITVVLSLLNWTGLARVVRGRMLALREEDYAVAARLLGASHGRIIFRHLLPGMTSHIVVALTVGVPGMILGETALSFLGLGLRPPTVSWGVMLQDCLNLQAVVSYPWLLMPVLFVVLTVLAFNFVGDGLRDAADPYAA